MKQLAPRNNRLYYPPSIRKQQDIRQRRIPQPLDHRARRRQRQHSNIRRHLAQQLTVQRPNRQHTATTLLLPLLRLQRPPNLHVRRGRMEQLHPQAQTLARLTQSATGAAEQLFPVHPLPLRSPTHRLVYNAALAYLRKSIHGRHRGMGQQHAARSQRGPDNLRIYACRNPELCINWSIHVHLPRGAVPTAAGVSYARGGEL